MAEALWRKEFADRIILTFSIKQYRILGMEKIQAAYLLIDIANVQGFAYEEN